ncbi:MAG: Uma2 family endonuclease [Caldilineaceae bacterium]
MAPSTQTLPTAQISKQTEPDWSLGWRYERVRTADGKEELVQIPLTPDEALHPEEGYVIPVRPYHERITTDLSVMLHAHYHHHPTITVFCDLVFKWDHPEIRSFAPDVALVPNVREPTADRGEFVVADEGTRPLLVIEVVSPNSRVGDRVTKVRDYPQVGVQEYIYIDHWKRRGQTIWEIAGFRLAGDRYLPIVPDEDGAIYSETLNLRIGIEEGQVWIEDANTGKELLTHLQTQQALQAAEEQAKAEAAARQAAEEQAKAEAAARQMAEEQAKAEAAARQAAEEQAQAEAAARRTLEARLAELEAQMRRLQVQIEEKKP